MLKSGPQHGVIRALIVAAIAAAFVALPVRAQDQPSSGDQIIVVTSGTGAHEASALKQAFSNAIEEAIGTIVDSETVVKDDKIISDQVLTASNAIVSHYDPVGDPKHVGGLVTVKIRAVVEKKQLTDRLAAANVVDKQVNGSDLFAQAVTDLKREKDATVIIRRAFDGFPGNVLKAEAVDEPRIISKSDSDAKIGVTVKFSVDMDKYTQWQTAFVPLLAKLATNRENRRWNPEKSLADNGGNPEGLLAASGGSGGRKMKHTDSSWAIPYEDMAHSYFFRDGPFRLGDNSLAIYERRGSTKVSILTFDPAAFREVVIASYAIPLVEVALKDEKGEELDAQDHVAMFRQSAGYDDCATASPFWVTGFYKLPYVDLPEGLDDSGWYLGKKSEENISGIQGPDPDRTVNTAMILPYCRQQWTALSGFSKEFVFTISLDSLRKLKSVEVKISSRNNALAHEKRGRQ